jgi:plastocyanin
MIWRLVISFSLVAIGCWCATVSGSIGLSESKDRSGVVVWLDPLSARTPDTPPVVASMAHQQKTFVPHVLAIRTGSKVRFPNLDPFFHNAFSNYDGEIFDIGLHPPGSYREVTFHRPGIVRLFCNIHPTMSAVIAVLDTPWFAVSDVRGAYRIAGVPHGEYHLNVFHERAMPDVLDKLKRNVSIGPDDLRLPEMRIADAGFVAPPHKNKYGKNYPPVIVDQYPGARR